MQPRTVALENSHPKPEAGFPFETPLLSVVVPVWAKARKYDGAS